MPDLETNIAAWRTRLDAALPDQAETVRELETHLRDHLEKLQRAGVPAGEAFAQAVHRLGESRVIAREFSRLRSSWLPRSWPARAVLLLLATAIATISFFAAARYSVGAMTPLLVAHVLAISTGYLTVLATGIIAAGALVTECRGSVAERDRHDLRQLIFRLTLISSAFLPVGILLGMVWARGALGRAWGWAPVETGAAFILFSTALLLFAQVRLKLDVPTRYVIAVLGAVVLAFAWPVTNAVTATVPIAWLCGAFSVSQIAVLVLASTGRRSLADD